MSTGRDVPPARGTTRRTGDPVWGVRIRPAARESTATRSRSFLSWCDELSGVRFTCPRCGRATAVLRRVRPSGCHPVYWLLCLSVLDRGCTITSVEVVRQLLGDALCTAEVCGVLREAPPAD